MPEELHYPSFYTLKEAASELNCYFNTKKIDANYILRLAITYDVKLYIFSQHWNSISDTHIELYNPPSDLNELQQKKLNEEYNKLNEELERRLKLAINRGCLLRITENDLVNLWLKKTTIIEIFEGIVDISKGLIEEKANYLSDFLVHVDSPLKSLIVNTSIIGIYPFIDEDTSTGDQRLERCIPSASPVDTIADDEGSVEVIYHSKVKKKDLIITKFELDKIKLGNLQLLSFEVNSKIEESKTKIKRPTGVSVLKRNAQEAARTLAAYLWRQDKDQKIKIKDMAITVYVELNQTEHADQLPDDTDSLRNWIKDIAPEYARTAGRPSNK